MYWALGKEQKITLVNILTWKDSQQIKVKVTRASTEIVMIQYNQREGTVGVLRWYIAVFDRWPDSLREKVRARQDLTEGGSCAACSL